MIDLQDNPSHKKSNDSITMPEGEEHRNTEEPMNTQELLNTMVASQIQLMEDMNLIAQQFQNLKGSQEENKTDQNSPISENLIDTKVIAPPTRRNITNNPLPNHNLGRGPRTNCFTSEEEGEKNLPELIYDLPKCFMMTWEELMGMTFAAGKLPELKKEDTNWVPIDWANYMDPNAMTTLLGDAICNIEEEEYWEACQHALKSPYETRTDDENEEGGGGKPLMTMMTARVIIVAIAAVVTAEIVGTITDSQDSGNERGESPTDREDEDVGSFYEDQFNDDVDNYDGDIEDDAEAKDEDIEDDVEAKDEDIEDDVEAEDEDADEDAKAEGINYDEYPYRRPLDWSCITDTSSKSGSRYDKHARETLELRSFHNSELGSLTPYTKEKDDINARLSTLDRRLMIHNFRNLTLKDLEDKDERMEGNESEYFQNTSAQATKGSMTYLGSG
ncbi:hypothetical protein SO802_023309 [Lithocarpus litseifolius]|uniref:Uncharacterized protein n=1 Tax=Lithocarpus litseifolius TaxID=425828 RepID=A0AAW2C5Y0_9ROSI